MLRQRIISITWLVVVVVVGGVGRLPCHGNGGVLVVDAWTPSRRWVRGSGGGGKNIRQEESSSSPRLGSFFTTTSLNHQGLGEFASLFPSTTTTTRLRVHLDREADLVEQMVGGQRYEMNEIPDSMMDTTVFVGNLDEFVQDEDLSRLFQTVSALQTVPACVVRKPDMSSLQYGFVSFLSVQEKEAAIVRWNGVAFQGRPLKVQAVQDTLPRVRIPEKMIAYVSGTKKVVGNASNKMMMMMHQKSLRRVSYSRENAGEPSSAHTSHPKGGSGRRKQKGGTAPNGTTTALGLNDKERAELERSLKKGFVTVVGGAPGNHQRRRNGPLVTVHYQWCHAERKPQICVYKAMGGSRPLDQVVVDLSPLRLNGLLDDAIQVEDYLVRWKAEILTAASGTGMQLVGHMAEYDQEDNDAAGDMGGVVVSSDDSTKCVTLEVNKVTRDAWEIKPMGRLPTLALVFQGERCNAKAMAKDLAILWDIPEKNNVAGISNHKHGSGEKRRTKNKMKGLHQYRKRGGGHRQAWG